MEEATTDMEIINAVFRAVHSIKGGAGAFGLNRLVNFAHTFETVLDKVRDRELPVDEKLMGVFHRSGDKLSDLVAAERDESELDPDSEASVIKELEDYLGGSSQEEEFSFRCRHAGFRRRASRNRGSRRRRGRQSRLPYRIPADQSPVRKWSRTASHL